MIKENFETRNLKKKNEIILRQNITGCFFSNFISTVLVFGLS
jgi:hypothetical protein